MSRERVIGVLDSLASAFGGHSQYAWSDVGRAIAGQINNNGLGCSLGPSGVCGGPDLVVHSVDELCGHAADWIEQRWEDLPDWDGDAMRAEIVAACIGALDAYRKG